MVRLISSIFVLALAAVQAFARPGGVEHTTTAKKKPTNFNATWECNYKYQGLWDNYRLVGRDWGINETMLERAVNKAGIVTKFKYSKWEKDGHEGFNTTFRLPLASASRLSVYCNQELGINPFIKNERNEFWKGVQCKHGKVD